MGGCERRQCITVQANPTLRAARLLSLCDDPAFDTVASSNISGTAASPSPLYSTNGAATEIASMLELPPETERPVCEYCDFSELTLCSPLVRGQSRGSNGLHSIFTVPYRNSR